MQQGRTLAVRAGERLERIDLAFPRGGVITGAVVDEGGEPLEGISVHVWQARFGGGRTVVAPVTEVRPRRTDDRGHYRIHGLLPGSYYLVASVGSRSIPGAGNASGLQSPDGGWVAVAGHSTESLAGPLRVFYPGRLSIAEATALQIDVAGHVGGADMTFAPSRGVRVSGIAMNSTGRPVSGPVLLTVSGRSGAHTLPPQTVRTDEAGRFEFTDVAPGDYVVQAIVPGGPPSQVFTSRAVNGGTLVVDQLRAWASPSTQPEFGMQYVTVSSAGAAPVTITTRPGSTLTGRLVLEGETAMLPGSFQLSAVPADFDLAPVVSAQIAPRGFIKDDWTFEMSNLIGPSRLSVSAPDGWWLKSATVDGLNAADEPVTFGTAEQSRGNVEIVLSSRSATLSGRVRDGRDPPVTDYSVIVFATDSQRWYDRSRYLKLARPSQDGRFDVSGLPPGEYWVAAVDAIAGDTGYGEWQNPDVLNGLTPGARRIALAEGQRAAVELRLTRLR
jgi:protocatechuate 3,4-dioxygenase beta subunit